MGCRSLEWPINWKRTTGIQSLFLDVPFIGTRALVWKNLCSQMRERTTACLNDWEVFQREEKELARRISAIVRDGLGWPNDLFIPSDPFEIVVWDHYGDLGTTEVVNEIERQFSLRFTDSEWKELRQITFGEVVGFLVGRSAEHHGR
jgi:hypothetical protein